MNNQWVIKEYTEKRKTFKEFAFRVEDILKQLLDEQQIEYHIITSRWKTIDSFSKKIEPWKYNDPINDITDLAWIRIITYVENSINPICKIIEDNFEIDKTNSIDKSELLSVNEFGYTSKHYIWSLNKERTKLPEYKKYSWLKFEIQVRTILQHTRAEIEHDRNYKFSWTLPTEIHRKLVRLSWVLELADSEFNNISKEIDEYSDLIDKDPDKLKHEINSISLSTFLLKEFKDEINEWLINPNLLQAPVKEMLNYWLKTIEDFSNIIPINFHKNIKKHYSSTSSATFTWIIRNILFINNIEKYFNNSYNWQWVWTSPKMKDLLSEYNIKTNDITQKINSYLRKKTK